MLQLGPSELVPLSVFQLAPPGKLYASATGRFEYRPVSTTGCAPRPQFPSDAARLHTERMEDDALFDELRELLRSCGVEIRVEPLKHPSDTAGGFCRFLGKHLVILDASASRGERFRALLEAIEAMGLEPLGLRGTDLSPPLLARLNRRGRMSWPHRHEAPTVARAGLRKPGDDDS